MASGSGAAGGIFPVHKGRTRYFLRFGVDQRTPASAALKPRGLGGRITIEAMGDTRAARTLFLLWRKGTNIIVGASPVRAPLDAARTRLRGDPAAYEIVEVPVTDAEPHGA